MADENVAEKLVVKIEADNAQYNTSIDGAVARTKAMQVQQKKLVEDLNKNAQAQERVSKSIENATSKYGANSDKVKSLKTNLKNLESGYKAMTSQLNTINKDFDRQQKEVNETSQSFGSLKKSMSGFTTMIAAAATGYTGKKFLEATIGGLAQFEQYETSFAVMLGSMDKAKAMMNDLQQFATKTPFELPDVTKAGTLLMNYGVAAEQLIPTMTKLGDLSQGQSEKLDRVSLAYGQMLAKGKVSGEELRQMTEAGVPLMQALADSMGKPTAEMSKLIELGKVGIPELDKAIESLTTGNGKFAGLMEKQSQTLIGLWSTVKDEMSSIAREMGEDAFVEVKDGLKDVMGEISTMRENGEMKAIAKDLGGLLSGLAKGFIGVTRGAIENKEAITALITTYATYKVISMAAVALNNFKEAQKAATVAQAAFNAVSSMNPYILLAGALTGIIASTVIFSDSSREATEELKKLQDEVNNFNPDKIDSAAPKLGKLKKVTEQTIPRIEELGEKSSKTAGEKELLKRYVEDLNEVLGYEAVSIDNVSDSLAKNSEEIKNKIKSLEDLARTEAINDKMAETYAKKVTAEMALLEEQSKLVEAQKKYAAIKDVYDNGDFITKIFNGDKNADAESDLRKINKAIKDQEEIIVNANTLIKKLSSAHDDLGDSVIGANTVVSGFWQTINNGNAESVVSDLKSMAETLQTLTSAQKEYEDSNSLSVSTLEALAKQYPALSGKLDEYSAGLIGIKDLVNEFPSLYETEKKSYVDTLKQKLQGSEAFYKQNILSQAVLVGEYKKDYKVDLSNFQTLAQAKGSVEGELINSMRGAWAEYYNSVGHNATKTVQAMQEQLVILKKAKETGSLTVSSDKALNQQIADIERMMGVLAPLQKLENIELNVDMSGIEANFDSLLNKIGSTEGKAKEKASATAKKVNDILKETYDEQLKIAEDYLSKRKKQIDEEYNAKAKKINESMDLDKKALDSWYNREKEQAQSAIDSINELINAKQKAREVEKLDDNLSNTQKRISNLQRQIQYSRGPEEKAELEKELARQQEELKDLTIQKEVSELESQKKTHEDNLSKIEERYKTESEYIEERRKAELSAIEETRDATLSSLEATFTKFGDELAATYGYVNTETLAIGQRFANATVGALEGGFNAVATKSQQVVDSMVTKVQDAIRRMNATMNGLSERFIEMNSNNGNSYSYDRYDNSRDNRKMLVTNNITRGLTEGQVSRMMERQAEEFLYRRR